MRCDVDMCKRDARFAHELRNMYGDLRVSGAFCQEHAKVKQIRQGGYLKRIKR